VGVALAYLLTFPGLLMKRADGSLHWLSWVVFWPYVLLSGVLLGGFRIVSRGRAYDEIVPGVLLGGRLLPWERSGLQAKESLAVLDLTFELPEARALRSRFKYRCIPLLDASAPSQDELHEGVEWLIQEAEKGCVYVHCAAGHGRSATFVAAYLLQTGVSTSPADAISLIAQRRPGVLLNSRQFVVLGEYAKTLSFFLMN